MPQIPFKNCGTELHQKKVLNRSGPLEDQFQMLRDALSENN